MHFISSVYMRMRKELKLIAEDRQITGQDIDWTQTDDDVDDVDQDDDNREDDQEGEELEDEPSGESTARGGGGQ